MGLAHAKGAIAPGMDADFAIVDPAARWTVTRASVVSSAGYSIYEGWDLTGRVVHTLVRGRFVLRDGALDDAAVGSGQCVRRRLRHGAHAQVAGSLREQALGTIRKRILELRYPPGSLLSENQLAEELGISRTPIREALRERAAGGLVRILPQRGVVVSEPTVQDIVEVYRLREQLECVAARVAAEHLTEADAQTLTADHAGALSHFAAGRLQDAHEASVRLHAHVIALARNARLARFVNQLGDQVHRFGLMTLRHGRAPRALAEHGGIIEAILARDGQTAEALMREHLRADRDMALEMVLPGGLGG